MLNSDRASWGGVDFVADTLFTFVLREEGEIFGGIVKVGGVCVGFFFGGELGTVAEGVDYLVSVVFFLLLGLRVGGRREGGM